MTKISHQIIGILSAYLFQLPIFPAYISSTLPDIDLKWQKAGKKGLLYSHRGITHHLFLCFILLISLLYTDNLVVKSLIVGYISHIFADIMTTMGIPYWSYSDRISLRLFKTGTTGEYLFVVLLMVTFTFIGILTGNIYMPLDLQVILNLFGNIIR